MRVTKRSFDQNAGIPDYYMLHLRWAARAEQTGDNHAMQEACRFARLAEEFGQAKIEDDDTMEC